MRYTENHCGVWIVPKDLWKQAAEKLARFEDAEELEDVRSYCQAMWNLANAERQNLRPDYANALEKAATKIIQLSAFRESEAISMAEQTQEIVNRSARIRREIFDFLDEIDGQIIDDPVGVIREKLEEVMV